MLVAFSGLFLAATPALAAPVSEASGQTAPGGDGQNPADQASTNQAPAEPGAAAAGTPQQGGGSAPNDPSNTQAPHLAATEPGSDPNTPGAPQTADLPGQPAQTPGRTAAFFAAATEAPTTPTITVDEDLSALDPDAATTVTVRGSGFVANAPTTSGTRPPLAGKFSGVYVVFGSFADIWQPSTGAKASTRSVTNQRWVVPAESLNVIGGAEAGGVVLEADGTFVTTLTLAKDDAKALAGGSWGIATYPGSGSKNAAFETFTPVTFRAPTPTHAPKIELFRADGSTPLGDATVYGEEQIVVKGSGFDPAANPASRPPLMVGDPAGVYVVFGSFADNWRPSAGAPAANRKVVNQRWALTDTTYGRIPTKYLAAVAGERVTMQPDGSFTATLTAADAAQVVGGYGVFTYVAGGAAADAAQELEARVTYRAVRPTPPAPRPTPPSDTSEVPQTAGSLTWGVSAGFRDYITGPIAKGSITTTGVGLAANGYRFPQVASTWNASSGTGSVQFSGTVRFSGHGGLLSETFSNPVITVTSPTTGTLAVGGSQYALDLASGSRSSDATGAITWTGVPVLGALSGGGDAGAGAGGGSFAFDPVSFTIGAVNTLNFGSTQVVSQSQGRQAAPEAPATTGITLTTPAANLVEGGEVEFTAAGFAPNETGILVVLYSEPTVLDTNARADANGVVRWIGTLPAGLTGAHTLTLQGSINAGTPITIQSRAEFEAAQLTNRTMAAESRTADVQAAGLVSAVEGPSPVWWIAATVLLVIAAGLTVFVVRQRRTKLDA